MLKKTLRLTTKQVSAVMEKGRSFHSSLFTVRVLVCAPGVALGAGAKGAGFAAIMSKKAGNTAVKRNLARRRTYEALGLVGVTNMPTTPTATGAQVVILCKSGVIGDKPASLTALADDLKTLLKKAGVL